MSLLLLLGKTLVLKCISLVWISLCSKDVYLQFKYAFHFSSEYKESEIFKALEQQNISRILLPDFLEAMYYLTNSRKEYFEEEVRIIKTIKHPFSLGIMIASHDELNSHFIDCLRLSMKWSHRKVFHNLSYKLMPCM